MKLKHQFHSLAWACRLIGNIFKHWIKIAIVLCILSPISPHVRLPHALTFAECDYIGTRGIVSKTGTSDCNLIEIINTRTHTTRWSL